MTDGELQMWIHSLSDWSKVAERGQRDQSNTIASGATP